MRKYHILLIGVLFLIFASCKKDKEFNTSNSLRLDFSTDTIAFDTVFTSLGSSTRQLIIYNNSKDNLNISSIRLGEGSSSSYSINVDGQSGYNFSDKEIFANDSLYVFVKVTIDPMNQNSPFFVEDELIFNTNGNDQRIKLTAYGQDAHYIIANQTIGNYPKFKIVADSLETTYWTADRPYVVYGHALINSYGTLVIEAGARIYFHNGSGLWSWSEGQLVVNGTMENPVTFQGDRLEAYYQDEPGQWDRIWLMEAREGCGHSINHAIIRNSFIGIQAERFLKDNMAALTITNTIIENQTGMGIYANLYQMYAANFVVANSGNYALALCGGGAYNLTYGTIANYWNESTRTAPSLFFSNTYQDPSDGQLYAVDFNFEMNNSIMYGSLDNEFGTSFYPGTDTTYIFNNSLLKTKRKIEAPLYNNCVINMDPKFVGYHEFNYHLDTLSPAIGIGDPVFSAGWLQYDLDGVLRGGAPDAGAYQFVPTE